MSRHWFDREWIEADGLGGFAMGTAGLRPTRRYHGLLTVARRPPTDRRTLLASLEERAESAAGRWRLDSSQRLSGEGPRGHELIVEMEVDPIPRWRYQLGPHLVERALLMVQGTPGTLVIYRHLEGPGPLLLEITPLLAGRFYHDLVLANPVGDPRVRIQDGVLEFRPYQDEPALHLRAEPDVGFHARPGWEEGFLYPADAARGYQHREDLLRAGFLRLELEPDASARLLFTTRPPDGTEPALEQLEKDEIRRRRTRLQHAGPPDTGLLQLSLERFLARREEGRTLLAGFPWFEDWGRDSFLSLPGFRGEGAAEICRQVLESFARRSRHGLVPNRFGDRPGETAYNAADASLLFVVEVGRLLHEAESGTPEDPLWSACRAVFRAYIEGTRHGIRVDPRDGLVTAEEAGSQLTWMDARIDDEVITPRAGKPVELQGLWMATCKVVRDLAERFGEDELAAEAREALMRSQQSFVASFWLPEQGWFADRLRPDGSPDTSLRPNQLLALARPECPVPHLEGRRALVAVDRDLLTPYGLRSLSPDHPDYRGRYRGGVVERDQAYHQGTVWPWLLAPWARAQLRFNGRAIVPRLRSATTALRDYLRGPGLGNLPEVFDGDPPHHPGGCPSQAWSVSALIQVQQLLDEHEEEPFDPTSH